MKIMTIYKNCRELIIWRVLKNNKTLQYDNLKVVKLVTHEIDNSTPTKFYIFVYMMYILEFFYEEK